MSRAAPGSSRVGRSARALALAGLAILGLGSRRAIADEPPSLDAALATIERHAVRVHFTFRRDVDAEAEGRDPVDPSSWTEQLRRWRMTWRITGWVVKDRRTVVSSDHFTAPGAIKSIEIRTSKGKTVPVSSWQFLPHAKLCVFRTETDLDTEPLPFPNDASPAHAPVVVGNVTEGISGLETWAGPVTVARRRTGNLAGPVGFDVAARADAGLSGAGLTNRVDLVMRPDGSPLGFRIGTPFDLEPAGWLGSSIVADLEHSVPLSGLAERARALHEDSFVHEVRFTYRRDEGLEGDFAMPGFAPAGASSPSADDARSYGYSISPNLLLVPQPIPDASIRRIEKVTVEDEGEPIIEASFEGRVKGTGAFLVRLKSATLDAPPADAQAPPPPAGHAFLVHRVSRRAGARRDSVTYDRSVGMQPGYGDRPFFASEQTVPQGTFLMDLDGKVFGVATELRPEDAERSAGDRTRSREGYGTIAALFSEGGGPLEWAKSLDRRALPQKSEEAKRLPWLGVEYVAIRGADVAEALELSAPTRDGTRGLLVNVVYADSPAAKAGLRVDDVLLSARRTCGPGCDAPPVDLKDTDDESGFHGSSTGDGGVPAPWAPRRTALVTLLESFEIGTTYDLELWRDGASKTVSLAVEQAPRDVDSALKSRDDATGLTVKELTYEVRRALHLEPTQAGVLVSAVEDGLAAFQARINVNELIREMDGRPVVDPAGFAKGLSEARAAGRATARVVVERLGRSRFVDLRLSGTDGPPSTPGMSPSK